MTDDHHHLEEITRNVGRDEMNLAEFPIALLSDRAPSDVKTIEYETSNGLLTITGSDDFGLPMASDSEVILALIQITRMKNNFTNPHVRFTLHELHQLLGWPSSGHYYKRAVEALQRWVGVTLRYHMSFWDNEKKKRINANFHILESVIIPPKQTQEEKKTDEEMCEIRWNGIFFGSCQANNLKQLDLETYIQLESSVSKRIYRFLDKRFAKGDFWTFDLCEFAHGNVGLSKNYNPSKIKEKLAPALAELEGNGFIKPLPNSQRYQKADGLWRIVFERGVEQEPPVNLGSSEPAQVDGEPEAPEPLPAFSETALRQIRALADRGVTPAVAEVLVTDFEPERIQTHIEIFDWLQVRKNKRQAENPGGFLADSIRKGYAAPKGFVSRTELRRRDAEEEARRLAAEEAQRLALERERAEEELQSRRALDYIGSLSEQARGQLRADALRRGNAFLVRKYRLAAAKPDTERAEEYLRLVVEGYVLKLLSNDPTEVDLGTA